MEADGRRRNSERRSSNRAKSEGAWTERNLEQLQQNRGLSEIVVTESNLKIVTINFYSLHLKYMRRVTSNQLSALVVKQSNSNLFYYYQLKYFAV